MIGLTFEDGTTGTIGGLADDLVTVRSPKPHPPGARISGTTHSKISVRLKIHRVKRGEDGMFTLEARVIDMTRALREALTSGSEK